MTSNGKLEICVLSDLDQTIIKTYKGKNGEPMLDAHGKAMYTREVYPHILAEEGFISYREATELGEPWLKLAKGELTNEQAAQEVNRLHAQVMKGKSYSDAVKIVKEKLAKRIVFMPYVFRVHTLASRLAEPTFGVVTNVYDDVCEGFHQAGKILSDVRVCNKLKVVDGKFTDKYEVDVSVDKELHLLQTLRDAEISIERTFAFADRYPQDAWVGKCAFVYQVGNDKDMSKFVRLHKGTKVGEEEKSIKRFREIFAKDIEACRNGMA